MGFQVTRHKLVNMATMVNISAELYLSVGAMMNAGLDAVTQVSMAKIFSTDNCDKVTHAAEAALRRNSGLPPRIPVEKAISRQPHFVPWAVEQPKS